MVVAVVDTDDKDHVMGEYTFHISELLKEEDMLMEARPFYITNNSTITMRLCLRVSCLLVEAIPFYITSLN